MTDSKFKEISKEKMEELKKAKKIGSSVDEKKIQTSELNKRVVALKLVQANYCGGQFNIETGDVYKSEKIALTALMYKSVLENGHLEISNVETALMNVYIELDVPNVEELVIKPLMSDIYVVLSGSDKFPKIHKIMSKAEFEMYISLVNDQS